MEKSTKYIIGGLALTVIGICIYNKDIKPLKGNDTVLGNDGRHIRNTLLGSAIGIVGLSLLATQILYPTK